MPMAEVLYLGPMEEPVREITESQTDGDCWFWNLRMAAPGKASGMQQ